jgi:hypothetical protein
MRIFLRDVAALLLGGLLAAVTVLPVLALASPHEPARQALYQPGYFPPSIVAAVESLPAPAPASPSALGGAASAAVIGWVIEQLLPYALPLLTAITGAIFWGLAQLWSHLKQGRIRHFGLAILDAGRVGALLIEQTVAPALRGPDGKLDPEAQKKAADAARAASLDWLRNQGWGAFHISLGMTDAQLEQRLGIAVEVAVADLPTVTATPTAVEIATASNLTPDAVASALVSMSGGVAR